MIESNPIQPSKGTEHLRPPEESKVKKGFWLGRTFTRIKAKFLGKPLRIITGNEIRQLQKAEHESLGARFEHNLKILKSLKKEQVPFLQVEQGRFVITKKKATPKHRDAALQLVKQTIRQITGKFIEARNTEEQEEVTDELNILRAYLKKVYPEVFPGKPDDVGSLHDLISGKYRKELPAEMLEEITRHREATDEKISSIRDSVINFK